MTIEFDSVFFLVTLKFPSFTEQIFQDPFPCDVNPIKSVYAEFSLTWLDTVLLAIEMKNYF